MNPLLNVSIVAILNVVNGLLLFASPPWYNPFVGILTAVALPFAAAMCVTYYYDSKGITHE